MPSLNHTSSRDLARSFSGVFGNLFRRRKAEPVDQRVLALRDAKAKRDAAMNEYRAAREIGDTRRMNEAHRSLRHATTDLVRLELAR